jgi:hypothetical protein
MTVAAILTLRMIPVFLAISSLYLINVWYIWVYHNDVHANQLLTTFVSDLGALTFLVSVVVGIRLAIYGRRADEFTEKLWRSSVTPRKSLLHRSSAWIAGLLERALTSRRGLIPPLLGLALLSGTILGAAIEAQIARIASPVHGSTVRAYRSWQDSGVTMVAGQRVSILANGRWTHRPDVKPYGPEGGDSRDSKALLPSAPVGALVGRIGKSAPFVVGETATIEATTPGPLQLTMNDRPDGRGHNRGRLQVAVTIQEE